MAKSIKIDNYVVDEPLINILHDIRDTLGNGKLKDILEKGDEIVCTCPNDDHDGGQENNPDCHIVLRDDLNVPYGTHNCFACNSSGSFVHFVALCFSSTIANAKYWLIKNYGKMAFAAADLGEPIKLGKAKARKYMDDSFLDGLQPWHPYLAQRRLDRRVCEKFRVRYDPEAQQIVFPVYDSKGNLLMAPRRSVVNKFFVLGKDQEKPLYGLGVIEKNGVRSCLLVEGPIDMLSCWSHGVPAIATLGAPAESQIEQIGRSGITHLFLACDNDQAGRAFNRELREKLDPRILITEVAWPMSCKDANDLTDAQWEAIIGKYSLPKVF